MNPDEFFAITPGGYPFGLILPFFFAAFIGLLVGLELAEVVEARVMLVGSVVYWVLALLIAGLSSVVVWWLPWLALSMILVLCADVTYMARYFAREWRTNRYAQPSSPPV